MNRGLSPPLRYAFTRAVSTNASAGMVAEMFDSSWKVRSIWDGVKLEVAEDPSPVVLHSFTHLDPDLPLCEVSEREREMRLRQAGRRRVLCGKEKREGSVTDGGCVRLFCAAVKCC